MAAMEPTTTAVEAALDRLLSSATFRGAPRLRRFLELVVRYVLAGEEDRIKEYTLGVEVFERGARFEPKCDAIVRVQAFKLREKLLEYYRTEGAADLVTISLPKGGYRPRFQARDAPPPAILDDPENLCCQVERLLSQSSPEALGRARHMLQCAIVRWPDNPDLHLALATTTLAAIELEVVAPRDAIPLLSQAAAQTLRLDPRKHEAHFFAALPRIVEPDKTAVLAGANRTLQASRSAMAHYWIASAYAADLRLEDMLMHMQRAVRLQPHALFFQTWSAVALFWAGRSDTAIRHLRDILSVEPADALANQWLAQIYTHTGRHDEARDAAGRARAVAATTQALGIVGYVDARAGQIESADAVLDALRQAAETGFVADSRVAAIQVALGRLSSAAETLRRGQNECDWHLAWARGDQRWEPLRGKVTGL